MQLRRTHRAGLREPRRARRAGQCARPRLLGSRSTNTRAARRRARPRRQNRTAPGRLARQRMAQKAVLLHSARMTTAVTARPATSAGSTRCRSSTSDTLAASGADGARVVPAPSCARAATSRGDVVLMPSLRQCRRARRRRARWSTPGATVGSCAQVGRNVHLSGGVGIGGVPGAAAGAPDHHRGRLLHRRALRGRRGRDRRARRSARRWASSSAPARGSTIASRRRSPTAAFPPARSSSPARPCR